MKRRNFFVFSLFVLLQSDSLPGSAQMKYAKNALNVAVMVFDGVEILDFTGPCEVFADASNDDGMLFNVYTVGVTKDQIKAQEILQVIPNYSFVDCPKPDIIVIPGGNSNKVSKNKEILDWLKKYANTNTIYLTVCTGAIVLANTGLLDGKTATTHYCCQDDLAKNFPKVKVVKDTRFVDNGKVITTEGISAGIDGSLYLVEKLFGHDVAKEVATYMMYDWRPDQLKKG